MGNKTKNIWAIIATGLLSFLGTNLLTGLSIAIPTIIKTDHVSTDVGQLINSGYSMMVGICILMSTYLLSRFSTKQLFQNSILLFILGLLLSGFAPNFWVLLIGRLITGIASGLSIPLMFNIILAKVPENNRGVMIGIGTLLVTMGPALGPVYGSLVMKAFGIPALFLFMLIIVAISWFLGFSTVEPISTIKSIKLDWPSTILLVLTLLSFTFGLSFLGSHQINAFIPITSVILAVVFTVFFFKRSTQISNPLLDVKVFRNSNFRNQNIAFFLSQVTAPAVGFLLSIYIQSVDLKSAFIASMVIFPGSLISAFLAPVGGKLLDKFGAAKIIGLGASFFTIGLLMFWLVSRGEMNAMTALSIDIIFMIGMGLSTGNLQTSGVNTLPNNEQSDGDAFFNASQQYSGGVGTALAGTILSAFQGSAHGSALLTGTHSGTSWAFCALFILAVISDWLLIRGFKSQGA
ncbi:MFS transporter [Levilactobacillus bambusae]|uniref:Major facilitator superfamily (MFS) profile domain-containing protein n=1 Tax=Levilactobacillus bambusae TaxID=2024736 RepID=A0A2V1N5V4_9LACO|nr:MFS transporter [Levilactobacillus bambusae]PWG00970.1 hypothetical protein DCM90_01990 [Levilactobacillus bambusae]